MNVNDPFTIFFTAIQDDGRISTTHIGLFSALLLSWQKMNFKVPLQVYSHQVMKIAKISSTNTYHKILRELNEYGYIKYESSYNRYQASKIYFNTP